MTRGVIGGVLIGIWLGCVTVAAVQLPPEVLVDKNLLQAQLLREEEDHKGALEAMDRIVALQKEHDLNLPEEFPFHYAQTALAAGLVRRASAERLAAAGHARARHRAGGLVAAGGGGIAAGVGRGRGRALSHGVFRWCLTLQFSFRGGRSWRRNPPALRASPAKGGLRGIFRRRARPRRGPLEMRQASIFKLRHDPFSRFMTARPANAGCVASRSRPRRPAPRRTLCGRPPRTHSRPARPGGPVRGRAPGASRNRPRPANAG